MSKKSLIPILFCILVFFTSCGNSANKISELSSFESNESYVNEGISSVISSEKENSSIEESSSKSSSCGNSVNKISEELRMSSFESNESYVHEGISSVISSEKENSIIEASSSESSSFISSNPPVDENKNNSLLEKYNLKMEVNAWNDYMPIVTDSSSPSVDPYKSLFVVSFTSITNTNVPEISVWAKITSSDGTIDVPLSDDKTGISTYKTFRVNDAQSIGMMDGEKLTAVITFKIGNEIQTLTFYPVVSTAY